MNMIRDKFFLLLLSFQSRTHQDIFTHLRHKEFYTNKKQMVNNNNNKKTLLYDINILTNISQEQFYLKNNTHTLL